MLDNLRAFASTWMGKIVGALLMLGLAGFGVTGVLTGIGTNNVATVGDEEITIRDFQRIYNAQLNNVASRIGTVPTPQQAVAFGIPSASINQLAGQAALTGLGKRFDLGVSDERLGKIIREDPNFGGVLGSFEEANFQRVLQQNGYTQNEYFAEQTDAARRQQLSIAFFAGQQAPKTAVTLVKRYSSDTRTIDYITINSTSIETPAEPTDLEVADYLEQNQTSFRTQPTRAASIMVLSPAAIAQSMDASEAEIAAEYERTKANYTTLETRTIAQAILSSDFLVDLFEQGLVDGKSFEQMISETGIPVTDLGALTRGQINDDALGDAAFELGVGDYTLLRAPQGMRAVSVTELDLGGQQALEDVSAQVADRIRQRKARDSYLDVLDQIEELRAAFRPLDEIGSRFGLVTTDIDLTADGEALSRLETIPADGRSRVASAIFNVDEGDLAPTVTLGANLNVWFDLKSIIPARDQTIEEVGDDIRATITTQRVDEALNTRAVELVGEVENGAALIDAASARGLFPQLSQAFGRQGDGTPVIDAQVAAAAFNGGPGFVGSARNAEGDHVVFQIVDIANDGEEADQQTIDFVDRAVLDGLYNAFTTSVREDAGLSINQTVLSQVLGLDGNQ